MPVQKRKRAGIVLTALAARRLRARRKKNAILTASAVGAHRKARKATALAVGSRRKGRKISARRVGLVKRAMAR